MSEFVNPGHAMQLLRDCIVASSAGCRSAIEFGCGFGKHLVALEETDCRACRFGVDAYRPYLLRVPPYHQGGANGAAGISTINGDALTVAKMLRAESFDLVLFIDFIEHLTACDADALLFEAKRIARRRIVAFVPEGEHPQACDATGLGGDHWQTHRSTWHVEDLQSYGFDVALWPAFHRGAGGGKSAGAMFAVWEPA